MTTFRKEDVLAAHDEAATRVKTKKESARRKASEPK